MQTLSHTVRFLCAIAAVAITTGLLSTVVAISEPQGSVLLAKSQHRDAVMAARVTAPLTVAMNDSAKTAR